MSQHYSFNADEEQAKTVKRFKNALIRKYRKLHGVWSNEIVALMEDFLKKSSGQNAHTQPARFTPFHKRLALIYFALPNGTEIKAHTIDLLIERYAGAHEKTKRRYWNSLAAWGLIIGIPSDKPHGRMKYDRGNCPDWLREAHELVKEDEK
ncbi:MAG: hypothetical protein HWN68_09630 [Desulfobacterales bacterium]|nr:hypothetical protein [Desulfobacterales bacterium]